MDADEVVARFSALQEELFALIDVDPRQAISRAEALKGAKDFPEQSIQAVQASIFIDAGTAAEDRDVVLRGVQILERIVAQADDASHLQYNLANGLGSLGDLDPYDGPDWYLRTQSLRQRAKRLYQTTCEAPATSTLRGRANANLGNALIRAYRFVEAYECYSRSLEAEPTNTVAATGAARVLLHYASLGVGETETLIAVANEHLRYARLHPESLRRLAGERAAQSLSSLLGRELPAVKKPDYEKATAYQKFVLRHRLALSPTIEGLDLSLKRWDSLALAGIRQPRGEHFHVPQIFATFNVLKADYLVARELAYCGIHGSTSESGNYVDTLDYARYGVEPSSLTLAQRACIDILDKIAVATALYLGDSAPDERTSFSNLFVDRKGGAARWRPVLADELARPNRGVIALADLSSDLYHLGFLSSKKALRNASTHRFTILHDLSATRAPGRGAIEHHDHEDFIRHVIESLQVVRAALLYFVEVVAEREGPPDAGDELPLLLFDHDYIRGRASHPGGGRAKRRHQQKPAEKRVPMKKRRKG